jgi:hypothetical protein
MMVTRHIYSHEFGLEAVEDEAIQDIMGNATVLLAVLRIGIAHPPATLDDIAEVYCPDCGWLDPAEDTHEDGCNYDGAYLR